MSRRKGPQRVLFAFRWLIAWGAETEARLLAKHLDSARDTFEVVECDRRPAMPEQTCEQLWALGIPLDLTPYQLPEEALTTLKHLTARYIDVRLGIQEAKT